MALLPLYGSGLAAAHNWFTVFHIAPFALCKRGFLLAMKIGYWAFGKIVGFKEGITKKNSMRRAILLTGFIIGMISCSNNSTNSQHTDATTDTTKNITTNSGAAGTGGVSAGFGTGGSTIDTNTSHDNTPDTSRQNRQ